MEFASLEREIHIDASPDVVFEVISRPEHIKRWWPDDALFEPAPGAVGELVWGDREKVEQIAIVDIDPPRKFSFHWIAPEDEIPSDGNSLLVTFELTPSGDGTALRLTETGWREKGWQEAVLEEAYHDHERGWELFLGRIPDYVSVVVAR